MMGSTEYHSEPYIAAFTGTLSRYQQWIFSKPCPRVVKGAAYILMIYKKTGTVYLVPLEEKL